MNNLCALTHSLECRLKLCCGNEIKNNTLTNIPAEEYIPVEQELEALDHVKVKRFRIYDRKPYTDKWADAAWYVRNSVVDDGDYTEDIVENGVVQAFLVIPTSA